MANDYYLPDEDLDDGRNLDLEAEQRQEYERDNPLMECGECGHQFLEDEAAGGVDIYSDAADPDQYQLCPACRSMEIYPIEEKDDGTE